MNIKKKTPLRLGILFLIIKIPYNLLNILRIIYLNI